MARMTYKESGVDIMANARWVSGIEKAMRTTYGPRVCQDKHGGFTGLFRLDSDKKLFRRNYKKPVLVGCSDGVGTKVLIAIKMDKLDTIGLDLVAMNVNDLICSGAEPLFFLDYLAVHKLEPRRLGKIIEGIAAGCREASCALLGGETAEMPDLYRPGHFDLAGFSVGVVERGREIDGSLIKPGDRLIGLPSSGIHSNGYSLVRMLIAKKRCKLDQQYDPLEETLGEALIRPTRIYVRAVDAVLEKYRVKQVITGMVHITGGGLRDNIRRVLPQNCDARLIKGAIKPPRIYEFLRRCGTTRDEMFKVFNMGIGFILIVRRTNHDGVLEALKGAGEKPILLGDIRGGSREVRWTRRDAKTKL